VRKEKAKDFSLMKEKKERKEKKSERTWHVNQQSFQVQAQGTYRVKRTSSKLYI